MKSIDSGRPPPQLAMIWICKRCPQEVRVTSERDAETQLIWTTKHLTIFVPHNDKEYCLHWDYINKYFAIHDTLTSTGPQSYIFRTQVMPDTITPDNALDKLLVYLLFS
jgi:hypothetical protein